LTKKVEDVQLESFYSTFIEVADKENDKISILDFKGPSGFKARMYDNKLAEIYSELVNKRPKTSDFYLKISDGKKHSETNLTFKVKEAQAYIYEGSGLRDANRR